MRAVISRLRVRICCAGPAPASSFGFGSRLVAPRMADGADHFGDADHLALRKPAIKLFEHGFGGGAGRLGSAQADRIAVDHGLDAETVLEHGEIGVIIAEEIAHEPDVVEKHDQRLAPAIGRGGVRAFPALARPRPNDGFRLLALLVTRPPELARAIQIPIL